MHTCVIPGLLEGTLSLSGEYDLNFKVTCGGYLGIFFLGDNISNIKDIPFKASLTDASNLDPGCNDLPTFHSHGWQFEL